MPSRTKSPAKPRRVHPALATAPAVPTVLVAVTGLSPAIVTETIWALAHEPSPVLPSEVVFITTATGASQLKEQLFSPVPAFGGLTTWQALRQALGATDAQLIASDPKVICTTDPRSGTTRPLDDIQSPAENEVAAGFILETVRSYVENPDKRLVASIAGGRKTMGALLHAAVTLLGRETDRLTHVLVSSPYESLRGFFFPGQPGGPVVDREGLAHDPANAVISLADVPFVPMRNRFAEISTLPGSFSGLVARYSRQMKIDAGSPPEFVLHYREGKLSVDGVSVKLRPNAMAILHALFELNRGGRIPFDQPDMVASAEGPLWDTIRAQLPAGKISRDINTDLIRHELGEIRSKLRSIGSRWNIPTRSLHLPPFTFKVG
jgi:CRISPR-associated protein (TIGR02584 family)